jgi:hypothetical protein
MDISTNPVSASVAGSLVSQHEISSNPALAKRTDGHNVDGSIIRDLLETTDRDADDRPPFRHGQSESRQSNEPTLSKGDNLDLSG